MLRKNERFVLSVKNIRRRGVRSWLTLLGILIGIAAVVALISLGNSLKDTVNSQFNVGSTDLISVQAGGVTGLGPPGTGVAKPLTTEDSDTIGKISSVQVSIPRNTRTVKAEFNNKVTFSIAATIPDDSTNNYIYQTTSLTTLSGKLIGQGDRGVIVIGYNFLNGSTNRFGRDVKIGDEISLNGKNFRVQGILDKKGSFIIDNSILINEKDLQSLLNYGNQVDLIEVIVKSPDLMQRAQDDIEKLMRQRRNVKVGQEDFQISTPQATLNTVNQIIFGIQAFIVIIASISILVGAIGIANTMATSVLERKKEIGIMKAIGARNSNIFYQFLIEAGFLGLVGGILGIAIGLGLSYLGTNALNSFLGSSTKPQINLILIFSVAIGSFLIGAVSGIIPAMRAARQNPVEAIRT